MNKILLTSICAAALTSAASAFTLDLSSLAGTDIGNAVITQGGYTFAINQGVGTPPGAVSGQITAGGVLTTNDSSTVIIDYDQTQVSFTGFDAVLGSTFIDDGGSVTLTTGSVLGANFDAVPEPSSTALLGLGGLALILRRRK